MKKTIFVLLVTLLLQCCKDPGPKISGHPAAYWIDRLSDVDQKTSFAAYQKLRLASPEDLKPSINILREAANNGAEYAPWLILEKFNEIDAKWVDFYVDVIASRGFPILDRLNKNETHSAIVGSLEAMKATGLLKTSTRKLDHEEIQKNKDSAALYLQKMGYDQADQAK